MTKNNRAIINLAYNISVEDTSAGLGLFLNFKKCGNQKKYALLQSMVDTQVVGRSARFACAKG